MLVGIAYTYYLVVSGRAPLMQGMLMYCSEAWLVHLTSLIFFSRSLDVLRQRFITLLVFSGVTVVMLAMLTWALLPPAIGPGDQPGYRMLRLITACFTLDGLEYAAIYLLITLGGALLLAFTTGNALRAWFYNVVDPTAGIMTAMVLTAFVAAFVGVAHGGEGTASRIPAFFLLTVFSLLRIGLQWSATKHSSDPTREEAYANFVAGDAL